MGQFTSELRMPNHFEKGKNSRKVSWATKQVGRPDGRIKERTSTEKSSPGETFQLGILMRRVTENSWSLLHSYICQQNKHVWNAQNLWNAIFNIKRLLVLFLWRALRQNEREKMPLSLKGARSRSLKPLRMTEKKTLFGARIAVDSRFPPAFTLASGHSAGKPCSEEENILTKAQWSCRKANRSEPSCPRFFFSAFLRHTFTHYRVYWEVTHRNSFMLFVHWYTIERSLLKGPAVARKVEPNDTVTLCIGGNLAGALLPSYLVSGTCPRFFWSNNRHGGRKWKP